MKAVTWHGRRDVRVEDVPDPTIQEPTDAIVRITSSGLCGSDLHLYETLGPFMGKGDVLGHEPLGIVEEVGSATGDLKVGDRVVMPFQICCGSCWMCDRGLYTQCETTQVRDQGSGAALFGFSKLYGEVPGAQAEFLRVPQAQFMPIKVPEGPVDERFLFLSDVLPTAWQSVVYADVPEGGTLLVLGLGPIGEMATRIALHQGIRVISVDRAPERLARAKARGAEVIDLDAVDDVGEEVRSLTQGRGADSVIDAVGMEAHGSPVAEIGQRVFNALPKRLSAAIMDKVGLDRMSAIYTAIDAVRRGGTVSLIGVYGGETDPMPMMTMFDKQLQFRMGQANVKRWVDDIMPLLVDDADPLGTEQFATHQVPLSEAPEAYENFQKKLDGTVKVVFKP
ncbi:MULTISPECIES: alcohol dehydrogenase catalytic domain-containing protein [unclassified Nocardioides]|uniref:alcohol dehydrogenase catalytic domain-containing protein n=1 Tax=unclassified Nocardioides TaxID=2615069 RepID=UPI0009F102EB|nr:MULTISPECIES: alcohol dehydrogenase catalytic domain-containing protein [unclassified Nocardioides]GAW49143.1 S-(hydroxymethyl)glutathione dehydrogenase [Nocardioides sp. PD653-B2]GAW55631.1 S-(hydroxymethyl)glutathione dehydrogenase [Nocardioides sp. PD653]